MPDVTTVPRCNRKEGFKMSKQQYGLAWSEEFELGCPQIDAQHKRLFELVNNLVKACTEGYDRSILNETLDFLVNYTVEHFKDEEEFQLRYNYPGFERHKQLHEDFKVIVGEKVQEFKESGSTTDLSSSVNKVVVHWLINHIQREDKEIGNHVRRLESDDRD